MTPGRRTMASQLHLRAPFAGHRVLDYHLAMLLLKPNCECCNGDLPPDSKQAWICSFECTFCSDCVSVRLHGVCPNCGGELVRRPIRPAQALQQYPASRERVFKPRA